MAEQKLDAIFMEGTTSMFYFANMRWGQSERTFGLVIPAEGDVAYVCPRFEEDRARELIKFGKDVRVVAGRREPVQGHRRHREGPRREAPPYRHRGARALLHRRRHSPRRARHGGRRLRRRHRRLPHVQVAGGNRADAARERRDDRSVPRRRSRLLREGMSQDETGRATSRRRSTRSGYAGDVSVQFGKWTALPHGSATPQKLKTATS